MKDKLAEKFKKKLWEIINNIDYSTEDYEYRGDEGDYTPSKREDILINDYAQGLLEEVVNAITNNCKRLGLYTLKDLVIDEEKAEKEITKYINGCIAPNYPNVKGTVKALVKANIIKVKG